MITLALALIASNSASVGASSGEARDANEAMSDAERDGTFVADPLDGERKAHLVNREQALRMYVDNRGNWTVVARGNPAARAVLRLALELDAEPSVGDDQVALDGGGVHQTWLNVREGIEHTIVIDAPMVGIADEATIRLRMAVGGMTATLRGNGVLLEAADGPSFSYRDLHVFDALGREQTSWLDFDETSGDITICADLDTDALYPITIDPITTTSFQSITFQSDAPNNRFGASMAVGDFNNDNIDDLVVGADRSNFNNPEEGTATLYVGSTSNPLLPGGWSFNPGPTNARCGAQVAAGDLDQQNGDDLVVLCQGLSTMSFFLNSGTGIPNTPTFSMPFGGTVYDIQSLLVADLDGQGRPEVVLGTLGAVRVFRVDAGNASATEVKTIAIPISDIPHIARMRLTAGDQFDDIAVEVSRVISFLEGDQANVLVTSTAASLNLSSFSTLAFAPVDYDGNGVSDLMIGDPSYNSNRGRVLVKDNNGSGVFSDNAQSPSLGGVGERLGSALLGADLNRDLHDDLVMCGTGVNGGTGGCRVFPGAPRGILPAGLDIVSQGTILPGSGTVGHGDAPPVAGDFRGDGGLDPVVPSIATDRITAWDGDISNLKSTAQTPSLLGSANSNEFFGTVIVMYDVNGDGKDDMLVGAPGYDAGLGGATGDGAVFAFAGDTTFSSTPSWTQVATGVGDGGFGSSIAVGRFYNASGPVVVAVGAPSETPPGKPAQAGRVRLFNAAAGGFPANNGAANQNLDGTAAGDNLGTSLTNAGNLVQTSYTGDCLAVGAPQPTKTPPSTDGGFVRIYRPAGTAVGLNSTFRGNTTPGCQSSFGTSVSNVGNVDGGQRDDLVVGAPDCHVPDDGGSAFLLISNAGNFVAPSISSWAYSLTTPQPGARLGAVVAGLGDTNNDGAPDFAVAAPKMDSGHGRIYIFNGKTNGLPNTTKSSSMSSSYSGNVGSSMAAGKVRNGVYVGNDVNRDGFMDLLEGEPLYSGSNTNQGRVRLFYGKPGVIDSYAELTLYGTCAACNFGAAAALADVGCTAGGTCGVVPDGYADAAISQPGRANGSLSKAGEVRVFAGRW
ncbi:MAG: FG-GAP repeat protein [Deltaproteobacteria bacterium]|nr:FG-GAP repeat protein [Deltaproteobacteria bacterium]